VAPASARGLVTFADTKSSIKEDVVSTLTVTPAQLEGLGGTAHRVSSDVRGQHRSLRAALAPLFGSDWKGAASAQFTTLYDNFDQHARGLSDALDGIAALLGRAGAAYADTEHHIANTFR